MGQLTNNDIQLLDEACTRIDNQWMKMINADHPCYELVREEVLELIPNYKNISFAKKLAMSNWVDTWFMKKGEKWWKA